MKEVEATGRRVSVVALNDYASEIPVGNYSPPSPERVYAVKSAAYANIEPLSPCK